MENDKTGTSSPIRLHNFLPLPGLNQLDLTVVSRWTGPVREGGDAPKPGWGWTGLLTPPALRRSVASGRSDKNCYMREYSPQALTYMHKHGK